MGDNILDKIEAIRQVDLNSKLELTSPLPPTVNLYLGHRAFIMYVKGKAVAQSMPFTTSEAKKYQKAFTAYATKIVKDMNWDIAPTEIKHFYMDCIFYLDRTNIDNQNLYKCCCDSINNVCYRDDKSILVRSNRVYYDTINPRIEIQLSPVQYIGIFDDIRDLDNFMDNNCNKCSKLKNNCSVLNCAVEGRVKEEMVSEGLDEIGLNKWKCGKFKEIVVKVDKVGKVKGKVKVGKDKK